MKVHAAFVVSLALCGFANLGSVPECDAAEEKQGDRPAAATPASRKPSPRLLVDIGVGYFVPLGPWSHHPLEQTRPGLDLTLFGAGPNASLIVGASGLLNGLWEVALRGDQTWLDTDEWEDFVAADGGRVLAKASLLSVGLHVGRDLARETGWPLVAYGGPTIFFPSGQEDFANASRRLEYDFLKTSWALRAGVGATWKAIEFFSFMLGIEGVIGTPIVGYPGNSRFLFGTNVVLRVRLEDVKTP